MFQFIAAAALTAMTFKPVAYVPEIALYSEDGQFQGIMAYDATKSSADCWDEINNQLKRNVNGPYRLRGFCVAIPPTPGTTGT